MMEYIEAIRMLGIDPKVMTPMIAAYFLIRFEVRKQVNELREEIKTTMVNQFDKLVEAFNNFEQKHNERMENIENHVGLKK